MKLQQSSFIFSVFVYEPLIKEKIEKYPYIKSFKLAYIMSSKRSPERERVINKIEMFMEKIFEILNSSSYQNCLIEYSQEMIIKLRKMYDQIKNLKISEKRIEEFEEKLKKIEKNVKCLDEIYPLSFYLSTTLKFYPKMVKIDYEFFKKAEKEKYLALMEKEFEKFPEKIIIFHAPIIALYFVLGGYKRMNLLQLSRLTGIFHKFIHILSPEKRGLIKLGKDFRKIPIFAKR